MYLGTTISYQFAISSGLGKEESDVTADDTVVFYQVSGLHLMYTVTADRELL